MKSIESDITARKGVAVVSETVLMVDENNVSLGTCDKIVAHRNCGLHRAFSVFLFDSAGRWLLQKRSTAKYHSGGLWSNTCCGHPGSAQSIRQSASQRLIYEMGVNCSLEEAFVFVYKCKLDSDMWEHEYDHVFIGVHDGLPDPNPKEVENWKWGTRDQIEQWLREEPEVFTYWFKCLFARLEV